MHTPYSTLPTAHLGPAPTLPSRMARGVRSRRLTRPDERCRRNVKTDPVANARFAAKIGGLQSEVCRRTGRGSQLDGNTHRVGRRGGGDAGRSPGRTWSPARTRRSDCPVDRRVGVSHPGAVGACGYRRSGSGASRAAAGRRPDRLGLTHEGSAGTTGTRAWPDGSAGSLAVEGDDELIPEVAVTRKGHRRRSPRGCSPKRTPR